MERYKSEKEISVKKMWKLRLLPSGSSQGLSNLACWYLGCSFSLPVIGRILSQESLKTCFREERQMGG